MIRHAILILSATLLLTGCDQVAGRLGIENPGAKAAQQDAEGRAVGSACRHSGRAIEDCYSIYGWLPKASVYAGWREMDEYMRENGIETIAPQLPPPEPPSKLRGKRKAPATEEAPADAAASSAKAETEGKPETPDPAVSKNNN